MDENDGLHAYTLALNFNTVVKKVYWYITTPFRRLATAEGRRSLLPGDGPASNVPYLSECGGDTLPSERMMVLAASSTAAAMTSKISAFRRNVAELLPL